ncbi:acetolactate synthase [Talaromyces pinophilus]|uniref:Acetolactate synthase n=1 Tax=Talaromyces pinophilus TaxID=128442 RepID=A0A6V8HR57_TALPI|nr:acetolactate synthase [Talaromyces pinophilus]
MAHSLPSPQPDAGSEYPSKAPESSLVGMTGGQIFHTLMVQHGVKQIFGYPGGAILPVFDAIYESKDIDFVLSRHEQGAGHMAEGYARASGKPGVVLVTSGPGFTNLITPIADALADGTPLVVFCGQVATSKIGLDSFQEADTLGMSLSCTKWCVQIKTTEEIPRRIAEAFEIATSGRPGPVVVSLPTDVTAGRMRSSNPKMATKTTRKAQTIGDMTTVATRILNDIHNEESLQRVAKLIKESRKPILYVGQGMLGHPDGPKVLKTLSDKAMIPVTTSLQGLGAYDETDPKALHMLGLHGSGYANMAMQHADLIIALGARFDDRVTGNVSKFAPAANAAAKAGRGGIIHFDISPKNINKTVEATEAVIGDCTTNLRQLIPLLDTVTERPEWMRQIKEWKEKYSFSNFDGKTTDNLVHPLEFISKLNKMADPIKDRTIITTGVGQHQMWVAQHFRWKYPRTMITSGGLGTMGYGLPAAIGAKLARPDALVIDIDGDASFNMTFNELSTASQYNIGVKVIVLNNEEQGMVKQLQHVYYDERYTQCSQKNADYMGVAEAMGIQGRRCESPEQVDECLQWLIHSDGPALLEVKIESGLPVVPMVPSGKGLDEFVFYDNVK